MPEKSLQNFSKSPENLSTQALLRFKVVSILMDEPLTVRQIGSRLMQQGIYASRPTIASIIREIEVGLTFKFQLTKTTEKVTSKAVATKYRLTKIEHRMFAGILKMAMPVVKGMITDDNVQMGLKALKNFILEHEKKTGGRLVARVEMEYKDCLHAESEADNWDIVFVVYQRVGEDRLKPYKTFKASELKADTVKELLNGIEY